MEAEMEVAGIRRAGLGTGRNLIAEVRLCPFNRPQTPRHGAINTTLPKFSSGRLASKTCSLPFGNIMHI